MSDGNRTSPTGRLRWVACLLALAAGCSDPVGPKPLRPALAAIFFSDLNPNFVQQGVLYVHALPVDTSFQLRESSERVPVEITTSGGDRENLGLFRLFCPPRVRGSGFECFRFALLMREGLHAQALRPNVAAIGGRLHQISISGRIANVTVFEPGNIVAHARRALDWPGVGWVDLMYSGCQDWAEPWCGSHSRLTVPVRVDSETARPDDGILQAQPGDTVVVRYAQPNGEILEARLVAR